jgi:hypothetical protein
MGFSMPHENSMPGFNYSVDEYLHLFRYENAVVQFNNVVAYT